MPKPSNTRETDTESERKVLERLGAPGYRPTSLRALLRTLDVSPQERGTLRRVVQGLVREGRVVRLGERLALPRTEGPPAASPARRERSGRERGREDGPPKTARGQALVGVVRLRGRHLSFVPFEPGLELNIELTAERGEVVHDGEAVVVRIEHGPRLGKPAQARILEVLGRMDRPGVDVMVVARRHELRVSFPDDVLREAAKLPQEIRAQDLAGRERFDDPPPVTIDGETARDFDDAIAVAALPRGGFRLFVHIADVAHFARPGNALDREAQSRGTSVYFPDRVFPMFPEQLSNELCSLKPGEDRLVQSVVLDLDAQGKTRKLRFADGVIRSAGRLTYTQVAAVLDGRKRVPGVAPSLVPMLELADQLRERLDALRRARGSVDLDLPEPRILLDVEGAMTGITIEPRNRAHRLIEAFMLAANEAVAGYLEARDAPCLYRIHERPDPAKMEALDAFASGFGLTLAGDPESVRSADIQKLLESAEGRPEYPILAQVTLRSMKQARYAPDNVGHFGLAAPVYTHFTSPIRRYPDLVVHRFLRAERSGAGETLSRLARGLEELGESCSRLEREAEAAERELLEWKKIAFIRDRVGSTFEGIVTGVTRFGLFVQLTENLVEGLLHVARLGPDRFEFVERRLELRGSRSGRTFRLGDRLRVVLDRVDPILRRVDFSLEHSEPSGARGRKEGRGRPRAAPRARKRSR